MTGATHILTTRTKRCRVRLWADLRPGTSSSRAKRSQFGKCCRHGKYNASLDLRRHQPDGRRENEPNSGGSQVFSVKWQAGSCSALRVSSFTRRVELGSFGAALIGGGGKVGTRGKAAELNGNGVHRTGGTLAFLRKECCKPLSMRYLWDIAPS